MARRNFGKLALIIGMATTAGAAGCFLSQEEAVDDQNGAASQGFPDVADALKSTLLLDQGCTAVKVGPRHLLLAARCVAGNDNIKAGKTITFKLGDTPKAVATAPSTPATATDAGDAGDAAAAAPAPKTNKSLKDATIKEVNIHDSYKTKCSANATCGFSTLAAGEVKDIAVLVLDADLSEVPTVPIDLDQVGDGDSLLTVASGCATFDATGTGAKAAKATAAPAKAVNHAGSPYKDQAPKVGGFGGAYIVTGGLGWHTNDPAVCKSDIGAPVFRADKGVVVGVTSNYTAFDPAKPIPVTVHHTRVSEVSKWLTDLGVTPVKSCSENPDGCIKREFKGDMPSSPVNPTTGGTTNPTSDASTPGPTDGGTKPPTTEPPAEPAKLPGSGESSNINEEDEEDRPAANVGDAGPRKKKKAEGGCSTVPGSAPAGSAGTFALVGLALGAVFARRRRSS